MGNTKTLLISVVLTGFAILLGYTYIEQREAELQRDLGEMVDIVIAARDLPEYHKIDETSVRTATIPKRYLPPNAVRGIEDLKDTVAAVPMVRDEILTTNKLLFLGVRTGLAPMVSPGKRAVAIVATSLNSVANLIKPGDRIDILAFQTIQQEAETVTRVTTVLQDVFVLSVGENVYTQPPRFERVARDDPRCVQKRGVENPTQFNNITIEVSPRDAQRIIALSGTSQLFYTLRNPTDRSSDIMVPTTDREIFGVD